MTPTVSTPSANAVDANIWEPDISWVMEHLAVGGCFPTERATQLARDHRVRAVVDLRGEDRDDDRMLSEAGIAFLHLPTPDLRAAPVETLDRGIAFVQPFLDRREGVLIHCQHGIGRSALLALCVMVARGLEPLDALRQAKDRRMRISPSEAQYAGWAAWLQRHGHPVPSYHEFGCIAYRHLAHG